LVEIEVAKPGEVEEFWRATARESLSSLYDFLVIWHEQRHEIVARDEGRIVGALRLRIAASLATVETLTVAPERRRRGLGRGLTGRAEELANYYNCHKVSVMVPHESAAQRFFTACGYHVEAVLPQHTFKLDMAIVRKFLL
jgi:ribosomal protein S18 acetylase RimI-like enzyme